MSGTEFLIVDEGEGWWHCRSPLRAVVLDGPAPYFSHDPTAPWTEAHWLVRTDPPIEWIGDVRFVARWGPDHQLCRPITPTSFALVMATSGRNGPIDAGFGVQVPAYPLANEPSRIAEAQPISGLAMKVGIRASPSAVG